MADLPVKTTSAGFDEDHVDYLVVDSFTDIQRNLSAGGLLFVLAGFLLLALALLTESVYWTGWPFLLIPVLFTELVIKCAVGKEWSGWVFFFFVPVFLLGFLKRIVGYPTVLGPFWLWTGAFVYLLGVVMFVGALAGPESRPSRELKIARTNPRLQAEISRLARGDTDATLPVILECSNCSTVFVHFSTGMFLVGDYKAAYKRLEAIGDLGDNFSYVLDDDVACHRCGAFNDYEFAESPCVTLAPVFKDKPRDPAAARNLQAKIRIGEATALTEPPVPLDKAYLELRTKLQDARTPDIKDLLTMACIFQNMKQAGRSRQLHQLVLKDNPLAVEAHISIGRMALESRDYPSASKSLVRAAELIVSGDEKCYLHAGPLVFKALVDGLSELKDTPLWTGAHEEILGSLDKISSLSQPVISAPVQPQTERWTSPSYAYGLRKRTRKRPKRRIS